MQQFLWHLLLTAVLVPNAGATTSGRCSDLFFSTPEMLEQAKQIDFKFSQNPDSQYKVTTLDAPSAQFGFFKSTYIENGELFAEFTRQPSTTQPSRNSSFAVPIARTAVQAVKSRPTADDVDLVDLLKMTVKDLNVVLDDIGHFMFAPRAQVYSQNGIHIYGRLKRTEAQSVLAFEIGSTLSAFDAFSVRLGLRVPEKTHIFLGGPKGSKRNQIGPYCFRQRLWSPWRGVSDTTINLQPGNADISIVSEPSVLVHERVHSLLSENYHEHAFFNLESTAALQEALADFLAAHYLNSPSIGNGIRDISFEKNGARGGLAATRNLLTTEHPYSYYDNSLVYSSALWRLRESIGREQMTRDLKGLLDGLASDGGPYRGFVFSTPLDIEHGNVRHFLRVLKTYYSQTAPNPKALTVIEELAHANFFSLDGLDRQWMASHPPENAGVRDGSSPQTMAIVPMSITTGKFALKPAAAGTVIYFLLTDEDD